MPSRIGCQLWHVPFNRKPELLRTSQPRLCNIALDNKQEPIRTVEEIVVKDKAGMIFSPRVGLHENVVVLDYENEYACLMKHAHQLGTAKVCYKLCSKVFTKDGWYSRTCRNHFPSTQKNGFAASSEL